MTDTDIEEPTAPPPLSIDEAISMADNGVGGRTFSARLLPLLLELKDRAPTGDLVEELREQLEKGKEDAGTARQDAAAANRKYNDLANDHEELFKALDAALDKTQVIQSGGKEIVKNAIAAARLAWFEHGTKRLADELTNAAQAVEALKEPAPINLPGEIPGQQRFPGM